MVSAWFPRPASEADLETIRPGGLSLASLYAFLHDPQGEEWKHKVGVAGPRDGSAKVTTRLLDSNGWVFKTDSGRRNENREAVLRDLHQTIELAARFELWHPDKVWFLCYLEPFYWPMTACPKLTTLRQVTSLPDRMQAWTRMLLLGLRESVKHGLGLDLNPSNFGYSGDALYYIDDETYPPLKPIDFGGVIASRIPEEPSADENVWSAWGTALQKSLLREWEPNAPAWGELIEGIEDWLLTRLFHARRAALVTALRPKRAGSRTATPPTRPQPRLTAVFADVHGNWPALQTVIRAARDFGVDSWLCLGDLVGYGPYPRECLEAVSALPDCTRLLGNHDAMVANDEPLDGINRYAKASLIWTRAQLTPEWRRWLGSAPIDCAGEDWLAVHGAPIDPARIHAYVYELTYKANIAWLVERGIRLCFHGHTHVAFVHRLADDRIEQLTPKELRLFVPGQTLLVNPGSVGQPRDGNTAAAFAIWDRRTQVLTFHRVEYPVDEVMDTIRSVGLPEDLAARLEIGR